MRSDIPERERLRALVADYCIENGVANLTLRSVSRAVGTNNRMLLYYFGSKEELIHEALQEAKARYPLIRDVFQSLEDPERPFDDRVLAAWKMISADENLPFLRLFFEVFGLAVREPDRYSHFIDSGRIWSRRTAEVLRAEGVPTDDARVMSRELVGLWRGLQFDLLASGSRRAIDATYEAAAKNFAQRVVQRAALTGPVR